MRWQVSPGAWRPQGLAPSHPLRRPSRSPIELTPTPGSLTPQGRRKGLASPQPQRPSCSLSLECARIRARPGLWGKEEGTSGKGLRERSQGNAGCSPACNPQPLREGSLSPVECKLEGTKWGRETWGGGVCGG